MGGVIYTPEAERDLLQIVSRIAEDNPSAALEWLEKIEAIFQILAKEPDLGEKIETRRWGLLRRRASGIYLLYYRRAASGVEILRVTHAAREQDRLV